MARITDMIQLSEILRRIRRGEGTNRIHKELGTHKTIIKQVRDLACERKWIDRETPLPDEYEISTAYRSLFAPRERAHVLDAYRDEINLSPM